MDLKNYLIKSSTKKADFARAVGVSPALLHQWIEKIRPVAIQHCSVIERETVGAVGRKDLRPDDWQKIWPELAEPAHRRSTDPAAPAGHRGRQPPSPGRILDSVPERAVVDPTSTPHHNQEEKS